MDKRVPIFLILLGLFLLYFMGVSVRRQVFRTQPGVQEVWKAGKEVPFSMESALQYRQTRIFYEEGRLPERDPQILMGEKGVELATTYSLGSERWYAGLAKILPRTWSLENRVRWASLLLFAFSIPLMALWVGMSTRSVAGGAVAGLLFAVCYGAVVRSTGMELSRENFALPWLIGFLAANAWSHRSKETWRFWPAVLLAGVCLAMAQIHWDLIQFFIAFWVLAQVAWWLAARSRASTEGAQDIVRWAIPVLCLVIAGLLNPYLRSHGFLLSAPMLLAYGMAAALGLVWLRKRSAWWMGLVALAPLLLLFVMGGESYGHFGSLIWAKIQHFNVKPADPSLLSFEQRIMWTPALHSTNWYAVFDVFPYVLYGACFSLMMLGFATRSFGLGLVGLGVLLVTAFFNDNLGVRLPRSLSLPAFAGIMVLLGVYLFRWARPSAEAEASLLRDDRAILFRWMLGLGLTWLAFVFFFRMHIFTMIFLCAVCGCAIAVAYRRLDAEAGEERMPWQGHLCALVLGIVALLELGSVLNSSEALKSDRPGVRYPELLSLIEQVKQVSETLPEPPVILGNFPVSASIAGYTDCPILLHPKFETADIRERVGAFYQHLYAADERDFYDWTQEHGAALYIHRLGALAKSPMDELQRALEMPSITSDRKAAIRNILDKVHLPDNRPVYMVGLKEPIPNAAVRNFEGPSPSARYFSWIRPKAELAPSRFRVFKIITHRDLDMGAKQAKRARQYMEMEDYRRAFDYAERTVKLYDPGNATAHKVIRQLTALLASGKIKAADLEERIRHAIDETPAPLETP